MRDYKRHKSRADGTITRFPVGGFARRLENPVDRKEGSKTFAARTVGVFAASGVFLQFSTCKRASGEDSSRPFRNPKILLQSI